MLALLTAASLAQAGEIESADLNNTAATVAPGTVNLHLFQPSSVGLPVGLDVKTALPLWLGGPNLWVEYELFGNDNLRISVEPSVFSDFAFENLLAGGLLRASVGTSKIVRINGAVGANYAQLSSVEPHDINVPDTVDPDDTSSEGSDQIYGGTLGAFMVQTAAGDASGVAVPLHAGVDINAGELSVFQIIARTNVLGFSDGKIPASGSVRWVHSPRYSMRISLGIDVVSTDLPRFPGFLEESMTSQVRVDQLVAPYPHFDIWWKL